MIQLEITFLDAILEQVARIPKRRQWEPVGTEYEGDEQATVAVFTNASIPSIQTWFRRAGGEVIRMENRSGSDATYITFRLSPAGESPEC